jgi:hypothetical protein
MRLAIAILLLTATVSIMLLSAINQSAMAFGGSDSSSVFGPDGPTLIQPGFGSDSRRMEDKIAGALAALPALPGSMKDEGADSVQDANAALPLSNSTLQNGSVNSSVSQNSSLSDNSTLTGGKTDVDGANIDASFGSASRFKGLYATRASRHEIGKGGIDSSMLLSGTFEMGNSIKFQDQGF